MCVRVCVSVPVCVCVCVCVCVYTYTHTRAHTHTDTHTHTHHTILQDSSVAAALLGWGDIPKGDGTHRDRRRLQAASLGAAVAAARLRRGAGGGGSRGAVLNLATMLALSSRPEQALAVLRGFLVHDCGRSDAGAARARGAGAWMPEDASARVVMAADVGGLSLSLSL